MTNLNGEQLQRYSRQLILKQIGVSGQKKLLASKVLVIGAGGLGSIALSYLAAAGVGKIGIADDDTVDLSNLQRQIIYSTNDVNLTKVNSAMSKIKSINPDINVDLFNQRVNIENIENIISEYDFIIDATDSLATKLLINDACVTKGKPFSHAGITKFGGQAMTYVPNEGPCLRCIFDAMPSDNDSFCSTCSEEGVIGAAVGVLGSIQALEAIKYITGCGMLLTGRMLFFDGLSMTFPCSKIEKNNKCTICSKNNSN